MMVGDNSPLARGPTTQSPKATESTSRSQLFCCKSIDKLISDSEEPERRLKKTLGPVALTSLGIGAVIGSGIFTVVGTAIAGQKFENASIFNAPLLDSGQRLSANLIAKPRDVFGGVWKYVFIFSPPVNVQVKIASFDPLENFDW